MQKLVTFIPADPEIVLALQITEETWSLFLRLLDSDKVPFEKSIAIGGYIIVPVDSECVWGWMHPDTFFECYEADEDWLPDRFTLCSAIKK